MLECQAIMIKFNYCMFPHDPAAIDCSDDVVNAGRNLSATQRASFLPTSTFEKPVPWVSVGVVDYYKLVRHVTLRLNNN